jgi:hypothetical protein
MIGWRTSERIFSIIIELMVIQVVIFVQGLGKTERQGIEVSKEAVGVSTTKERIVNKIVGDALVIGAHHEGDSRRQQTRRQVVPRLPE